MVENGIEEIRQKKLEELQRRYAEQQLELQKVIEAEMQIDALMRAILTPEAKARLSNVKMVDKEKYLLALQTLIYLKKAGQLPEKVNDAQLKEILARLNTPKREIKIRRK